MRTGAAQAGRRRLGVVSVTLARNVATHIQTQRHTHRDTQLRHSLELCSYPLFARTLRHFSTTFYGAAHPLSPLLPLPHVQSKKHSTQTKALFPFSSGFSLPACFLSFFLFFGKVVYGIHFITLPALPFPLSYSLSLCLFPLWVRLSQSVLAVPFL